MDLKLISFRKEVATVLITVRFCVKGKHIHGNIKHSKYDVTFTDIWRVWSCLSYRNTPDTVLHGFWPHEAYTSLDRYTFGSSNAAVLFILEGQGSQLQYHEHTAHTQVQVFPLLTHLIYLTKGLIISWWVGSGFLEEGKKWNWAG